MMKRVSKLVFMVVLLCWSAVPMYGLSSSKHFYATKTTATPTGAGEIYVQRGQVTESSNNDFFNPPTSGWKSSDETFDAGEITVDSSNPPDGFKVYNGDDDSNTIGVLYIYFYAKPKPGFQFDGWYKEAAASTKLTGSTDVYSTAKTPKSKTPRTPTRWNNGKPGSTPPAVGEWDGVHYMRHVEEVANGQDDDITRYAKFSYIPRHVMFVGTGFDDVSYTAGGTNVGASTVESGNITSDIALSITYDATKYNFVKWQWSVGISGDKTDIATTASATYTFVANRGCPTVDYSTNPYTYSAYTKVYIWPVLTEKADYVAEVTYNEVTTPYESWADAFAAAKATGVSGAVIKLKKAVTGIDAVQTVDRNMTLNLNGFTITGSVNNMFTVSGSGTNFTLCDNTPAAAGRIVHSPADPSATTYALSVASGATLTLTSGGVSVTGVNNVANSAGSSRGVEIKSGATLVMSGGEISAQSTNKAYALVNGGTATISGGVCNARAKSASSAKTGSTAVAFYNSGASATINGGTFTAVADSTTAYGIQHNNAATMTINYAVVNATVGTGNYAYDLYRSNGKIMVYDGKFKGRNPSSVDNKAHIEVQGGIYDSYLNLRACASTGFDCYELEQGADYNEGYRFVVKGLDGSPNVCKVITMSGTTYYSSLVDAFNYVHAHPNDLQAIVMTAFEYNFNTANNYTVPQQTAFVVPYGAGQTGAQTTPADIRTWASLSQYHSLALGAGVNITVQGTFTVGGQQFGTSSGNPGPGSVTGSYAMLDMSAGGHLTIANGANLYAYGFIKGAGDQSTAGTITIQNGGTVYEDLVINDMHGGGGTAACVNGTSGSNSYGLFPFSQYFIQNIEPRMTIEYGGIEKASYNIQSSQGGMMDMINLIGNTTGYLFQMASGSYVTKWYDASRDYQCYEVSGGVTMNGLTIDAGMASMSSSSFILPINNNMDIRALSGAVLDIPYSVKFQPGSKLTIDEGAIVDVHNEMYVYDYQDWDKYAMGAYAQTFGTTASGKKLTWHTLRNVSSTAALGNASIVINGQLRIKDSGALYTTSHGSNITSTGSGKIIFNVAGKTANKNIYECWGTYGKKSDGTALAQGETDKAAGQVQVGSFNMIKTWYIFGTPIECNPAKLRNSNDTYISTSGAVASDIYQYCGGTWVKGGCTTFTVTWKSEDGNTTLETDTDLTSGATTAFNSTTPSKDATAQYTYTFDGWTTEANGGGTFYANGSTPNVSGNATYYAHFSQTPRSYTLSWVTDGDVLTGSYTSGTVAYATTITAPDTPTKTGYTFAGWHNGSSVVTPSTMPAENTTYTATWTCLEPSSLSVASTGNKWDFCAGESMTLTVIGSNIAADATYQWKLNGSPISGATGSTYMVASMARANAGTYTCTVTNGTCNATTSGYDIKVWTFYHNASGSFAHGNLTFSSAGKGTITVELAAGQTYEFKLNNNMPSGNWFGNAGTMTGTIAEASAWVFGSSINSNCHITAGLAGNYEFIVDYSNSGSPKVSVTYPTANQPSGRKIYFDKSGIDGWGSNVYYRIGHTTYNSNQTLSLVLGTDQFYEMTTNGFDGFEAWHIANNVSWADDNSIYKVDGSGYAITKATNFQKYVVGSDGVTIVPTTENNTENGCTYWNVSTSDGMLTHTATISTSANGTITIFYTDVNGASQSKTSTTAGLAHRCILTITATPNPGYSLSSLTVNGAPFTSGNTYILAADATIAATWANVVIGSPLDIVDWTETELTLNANGWSASGWPYTINGTTYYKDQKSATDAGSSNYRAADRTLTIPYGGEAGADLWITLESGGSIINKNSYSIPFINTTSGTNASSIVYVNSGTLTISSNTSLAALYVRPESRVNITSGTLTVGKLVMRTLPWQAAAINGDFEAAEVWYTRIAPNKRTITGPYAPITYESSSYYQFALPRNCTVKLKDVQVSHGANTPYGNTWILKRYNEETRAANGTGEANWVVLDEEEYIQGGVGYEMSSNSNYYREFYFPLGAVSSASIGTTTAVNFHSGAAGTQHAGWNWVASPLMGVFDNSDADPETGMKIGWLLTDGSYDQGIPDYIYPAIPFAYQTSSGQSTISFAGSYIVASVPQRRVAAEEESVLLQWFHLDVKDVTGVGDHTSILTHPMRYEEAYKPGIDVAKQSFAASHALIYSSHAYGEMAFAGVADSLFEQGVALTVYSPKAQELTISMRENEWLNRMAYVWLIDNETGAQIDLLDSDYSFNAEAGTMAGRFILMGAFFAPQITTDNGTVQSDEDIKAKKFIYKDKIYIQINGVIYDATGRLVK